MANFLTKKELDDSLDELIIKLFNRIDKQTIEVKDEIAEIDEKYNHLVQTDVKRFP